MYKNNTQLDIHLFSHALKQKTKKKNESAERVGYIDLICS